MLEVLANACGPRLRFVGPLFSATVVAMCTCPPCGQSFFSFPLSQGRTCSRATMMQKLNAFVGADMGDVDRYVLKQGSTMVGRGIVVKQFSSSVNSSCSVHLNDRVEVSWGMNVSDWPETKAPLDYSGASNALRHVLFRAHSCSRVHLMRSKREDRMAPRARG